MRLREIDGAVAGERALLLAHFLAGGGVGARAQQRLEVGDQRAAEAEIGRTLMRQQRERIGGAGPGQRLVGQPQQIGAAGQARQHRAQVVGLDGGGDVAPPQAHVEIGVLAAEKFHHPRARELPAAERPQEQRRAGGIEADDDEGGDAGGGAEVALPELEEVVALIGRGEAVAGLQRPPMRLGGGHVLDDLDLRDAAIGGRRKPVGVGARAQGKDIHGRRTGVKLVNLGHRLAKIYQ